MNNKIVLKKEDVFFFFPYSIFLVSAILSTTFFYKYYIGYKYTIVLAGCLMLILAGIFLNLRVSKKALKGFGICIFSSFLLAMICKTFFATLVYIPIFIFAARDIKFEKIAKVTLALSGITVTFIIFCGCLNITYNYTLYATDGRIREALGFRYFLTAPAFMFNITCLCLYINKHTIKWKTLVLLLLCNFFIFLKTGSRLSFYLAVIAIALFTVNKVNVHFISDRKILMKVLVYSFVICCIGSYFVVFAYGKGSQWAYIVNELVGNRVRYAYQSIVLNGFSLWGKKVEWNGYGLDVYGNLSDNISRGYTYVDCLYVHILQKYGIILTFIYVVMYTFTLMELYKKKDYYMVLILSLFAMHGMIDDHAIYLYFNTFWFVIGITLLSSIRTRKIKIQESSFALAYRHNLVLQHRRLN